MAKVWCNGWETAFKNGLNELQGWAPSWLGLKGSPFWLPLKEDGSWMGSLS